MKLYAAPMEGVTDYVWRRAQQVCFTAPDSFYTPFISPTQDRCFTAKEKRELLPEHNRGARVVPQLMGHNADDLLWAIGELKAMGYDEVNLNLGCPSGTVVAKKKGSGLLGHPELLRPLLDSLYERSPLPLSLKTRIGLESAEEFPALLDLFNDYPIPLLIVHPRLRVQFYKGEPDMSAWSQAAAGSRAPLCYNGNLFDRAAAAEFCKTYPAETSLMLGRGAAANPKLFAELKGEAPLTRSELEHFCHVLQEGLQRRLGQDAHVLQRLKELWFYMGCCFEGAEKPMKKLRKAQTLSDGLDAVSQIFAGCPLRSPAGFCTDGQ